MNTSQRTIISSNGYFCPLLPLLYACNAWTLRLYRWFPGIVIISFRLSYCLRERNVFITDRFISILGLTHVWMMYLWIDIFLYYRKRITYKIYLYYLLIIFVQGNVNRYRYMCVCYKYYRSCLIGLVSQNAFLCMYILIEKKNEVLFELYLPPLSIC